ncbi:MAG: ABC transporter substrate-binding protein [candidate division WWE3 bacterium]|nr:ABC transporter substrate-binding protein [candidate division WWE3 bacterium]
MILQILSLIRSLLFFAAFFAASILPQPTYVEGVTEQPTGFVPVATSNDIDRTVQKIIYRSLFKYDVTGTIIPDLADYWEVSADGLTYTVRIKASQRWQDGKSLSANDIIYTASNSRELTGVATDRLDSRTVRFTLPNKFSPFYDLLTIPVLPAHLEGHNDKWLPVGSSNYRVIRVDRDRGLIKDVILQGNSPSLAITRVEFKFYDSEKDLETAAKLGEVNAFSEKEDQFSYNNYTKISIPEKNRYYALFFNTRDKKLADVSVRAKLASGLSVSGILKNVFGDNFVATTGPLSLNKFARGDLDYAAPDSKKLELPKELRLAIVGNSVNIKIANEVSAAWKLLSVKVKINVYTIEQFNSEVIGKRDFDVLLFGQEVSSDPDRYVLWHSSQANFPGLNLSGIANSRIDKALEEGRKEKAADIRQKHYSIFQKAVMDEVPAIFLYHPIFNYYVRDNLNGLDLKNFSLPSDRFLSLSNWGFK